MMLSSRVIKRVDGDMETWPVQVRTTLVQAKEEEPAVMVVDHLAPDTDLILIQARNQAEKLLNDTYQRIDELEQAAYEKGYNHGQQEAMQVYQQAVEDYHRTSREQLRLINELHQRIYEDSEQEIVVLAVQIAQKLVCRQLEIDPETVVDIARAACLQARECERVIVYAAPAQIEGLKNRKEEIETQLYRAQKLEFIADPSIVLGGCRIETEQGYIDATIDTMLEQIKAVIRDEDQ